VGARRRRNHVARNGVLGGARGRGRRPRLSRSRGGRA
jgi:hypothetical protein